MIYLLSEMPQYMRDKARGVYLSQFRKCIMDNTNTDGKLDQENVIVALCGDTVDQLSHAFDMAFPYFDQDHFGEGTTWRDAVGEIDYHWEEMDYEGNEIYVVVPQQSTPGVFSIYYYKGEPAKKETT